MFNFIKRYRQRKKQEKKFNNYIFQHKAKMIKLFYEILQWQDCEWIIKDVRILNELWYRILEHDDSLYSKAEYKAFRAHYYPIDIYEKIDNEEKFEKALEHHYRTNDHHWQYRKDYNVLTLDVKLACVENLIDWIARKSDPYSKYYDIIDSLDIPVTQRDFMKDFLSIIEKNIKEQVDD